MDKKLYLSDTDKKLFGVCGGLAEYFGIDSTVIRLLWIIFVFVMGTGLLAYLVAALIMPRRSHSV
ncbi:MAG: PspC domain-containing protein [Bacillota bacterium]